MKRAAATSVLTLAGVLSAGAAAALVNSRILGNAEGGATETNRVELVEAPRLIGPGRATSALVTVPPATPAATTAVAASSVTAPADINEAPAVEASSDTATAPAAPARPATPSTSRSTGARDPEYPSATAGATQPTVAPATPPTIPATVPPTPVTSTPSTAASTTSSTAPSTPTSTNVRRRPRWPRYGPSTSPPRWTPDD
jgi:DNA polymerase-3 subunit gamma/tau